MQLKYTDSGYLIITAEDDCIKIVDLMLANDYNEEFCVAIDFSTDFIIRLMEAGFLVMSTVIESNNNEPYYLALPKLHLVRSALFFENLHIKKSIKKHFKRYELRANTDFDLIINRCLEKHGDDWLTPPLVDGIKKIREDQNYDSTEIVPVNRVVPVSFGLYKDNVLVAGEFGIVYRNVYTSYSGYFDESNAGTVQIIFMTQYLQKHGFSFLDLGMPLPYKYDMGAVDISPRRFVQLFRRGNHIRSTNDFK